MADRPLNGATPIYPEFATDDITDPTSGEANVQEPSSEVKASGWRRLERPPRFWFNWLHRLYYRWVAWFDQEIESFRTILNVTLPGQISALDGRIDTLEGYDADNRLDTLETAVNTTMDGRLDDLETFETNVGAQYALPYQIGSFDIPFVGIDGGAQTSYGSYILHSEYSISGAPAKVAVYIGSLNGTASVTEPTFSAPAGSIPTAVRPAETTVRPITVYNDGHMVPGIIRLFADGSVDVLFLDPLATNPQYYTNVFSTTGTKGLVGAQQIEYLV